MEDDLANALLAQIIIARNALGEAVAIALQAREHEISERLFEAVTRLEEVCAAWCHLKEEPP